MFRHGLTRRQVIRPVSRRQGPVSDQDVRRPLPPWPVHVQPQPEFFFGVAGMGGP